MRETVPNNALITFKLFKTKLLTYLLTYSESLYWLLPR